MLNAALSLSACIPIEFIILLRNIARRGRRRRRSAYAACSSFSSFARLLSSRARNSPFFTAHHNVDNSPHSAVTQRDEERREIERRAKHNDTTQDVRTVLPPHAINAISTHKYKCWKISFHTWQTRAPFCASLPSHSNRHIIHNNHQHFRVVGVVVGGWLLRRPCRRTHSSFSHFGQSFTLAQYAHVPSNTWYMVLCGCVL